MITENFDARFSAYAAAWARQNTKHYRTAEDMEAAMPDVYTRWLNTPASWLGGKTPGFYFTQYDDPDLLITWMRKYVAGSVPLPDPLLERITELGARAQASLISLLQDDNIEDELIMLSLSLLAEIDADPPVGEYLRLILRFTGEGEVAVKAAETLRLAGASALPACLRAMIGAPRTVRLCLMDVLADFPGERAVVEQARQLMREGGDTALVAAYIARIGDACALEELYAKVSDPYLDYLTYVELCNAIEVLGGDPPTEREFAGDPAYESLKRL